MRQAVAALFVLMVAAPTTEAQTIGANTPFRGLEQWLSGIDVIKAEIASLRRQLSSCDGPGASRAGACASRALLQAKLNWLLEVSTVLGDPDTAGAPPMAPTKPPEPSDYEGQIRNLYEQIQRERGGVYIMSENRAKYWVINHCIGVNDLSPIRIAYMTPEEGSDLGGAKMRAAINACINEYDVKVIIANRKTAFEYCMQIDPVGPRLLLNLCMHRYDMLTAMCKQGSEVLEWWKRRNVSLHPAGPQR